MTNINLRDEKTNGLESQCRDELKRRGADHYRIEIRTDAWEDGASIRVSAPEFPGYSRNVECSYGDLLDRNAVRAICLHARPVPVTLDHNCIIALAKENPDGLDAEIKRDTLRLLASPVFECSVSEAGASKVQPDGSMTTDPRSFDALLERAGLSRTVGRYPAPYGIDESSVGYPTIYDRFAGLVQMIRVILSEGDANAIADPPADAKKSHSKYDVAEALAVHVCNGGEIFVSYDCDLHKKAELLASHEIATIARSSQLVGPGDRS